MQVTDDWDAVALAFDALSALNGACALLDGDRFVACTPRWMDLCETSVGSAAEPALVACCRALDASDTRMIIADDGTRLRATRDPSGRTLLVLVDHPAHAQPVHTLPSENQTLPAGVDTAASADGLAPQPAIDDLRRLAYEDPLTGLPNRNALTDALRRHLDSARSHGVGATLVQVSLDQFPAVTESFGRSVADELVATVADRLRAAVPQAEVLAHVGGEEFVFTITDPVADRLLAARWILADVARPVEVRGRCLHVTVSAGAVDTEIDAAEPTEQSASARTVNLLLRNADLALRRARRQPSNDRLSVATYHAEMVAIAERELTLAHELHQAIDRQAFTVHYQTIHAAETLDIAGLEALVRWEHPTRGFVPPAEFLPLAEEANRITEIDEQVLEQVIALLVENRHCWPAHAYVTVNWSAHDLASSHLIERLRELLVVHDLPGEWLAVELTEHSVIGTDAAMVRLHDLRALGVRVLLDDFGTGYAAYENIQHLPLTTLKVDQSFTRGLGRGGFSEAIISSLVTMTDEVGLDTVVEGVETADQLERLRTIGPGYVQGFLLGHPAPAVAVLPRLINQ